MSDLDGHDRRLSRQTSQQALQSPATDSNPWNRLSDSTDSGSGVVLVSGLASVLTGSAAEQHAQHREPAAEQHAQHRGDAPPRGQPEARGPVTYHWRGPPRSGHGHHARAAASQRDALAAPGQPGTLHF
eukprot:1188040-Prorocentrum_minimum.AAC.1